MPTPLFAQHRHLPPPYGPGAGDGCDDLHLLHSALTKPSSKTTTTTASALYIISEHDYVRSVIPPSARDCVQGAAAALPLHHHHRQRRRAPRSLMAALSFQQQHHSGLMALGPAPGSPPDLTNSKSSKSSSFHSSSLPDCMASSDLSHFEDITLDDAHGALGPASFPAVPSSPSHRLIFDGPRNGSSSTLSSRGPPPLPSSSSSSSHLVTHNTNSSFRDLTGAKPRFPTLKTQAPSAHSQLAAPSKKQPRRGFTSPSAPSLQSMPNLAAPGRRSRSPSPTSHPVSSAPRTLSRKSSRGLDMSPASSSSSMAGRRQSWQHPARKTVKEREAECDNEDDELPEDAIIWNVPMSPRPVQERSPSGSAAGSPPQPSTHATPSPVPSRPPSQKSSSSSRRTSPAVSLHRIASQPSSPDPASTENTPTPPLPQGLARQRTNNNWEDTYTALDDDAKKMTEALEEYQTDVDRQEEVRRQQPGVSRSSSVDRPESKPKAVSLPPLRKSDPLIDPFQPSSEKQKYLSRTRPSWLPPKDPREEKKHLKEYQKMLARIQEAERLEAQRQEEEAVAREKAERIKAEYWSNLLLPNWDTEMSNPQYKGTHRKMWWNGIPAKLRGTVWAKAIGNDLEITETTFEVAYKKALETQAQATADDDNSNNNDNNINNEETNTEDATATDTEAAAAAAVEEAITTTATTTPTVFPDLKMFGPNQPLHHDLTKVCLAYAAYRPDVDSTTGIPHLAGLFLLNMSPLATFTALANLHNRPLPLSFLVHDTAAMTNAFDTTLSALSKKSPSLARRLATLRVEPREYLSAWFRSLFCDRLGVEHAARVMDVYAVEGDKIPPRVAVAVLGMLEGPCVEGGREEVGRVLRTREVREGVDAFMGRVYEAGKMG